MVYVFVLPLFVSLGHDAIALYVCCFKAWTRADEVVLSVLPDTMQLSGGGVGLIKTLPLFKRVTWYLAVLGGNAKTRQR